MGSSHRNEGQVPGSQPTETSTLLQRDDLENPRTNNAASLLLPSNFDEFTKRSDKVRTSPSSISDTIHPSHDEESLLQNGALTGDADDNFLDGAAVLRIILVLLIAVFIFNADHSLVLATHPSIGSEFNALEWSSWLFTGFSLAGAAMQTIIAKLSDIYGRKPIILLSYAGFAIGCVITAVAPNMLTVILGRVLSGSVGISMAVLVTILITDLVPIRESASWRAYVNVAAATGRSLGAPLGGWLADVVGWRCEGRSFGIQAPMFVVAILLCWRQLPSKLPGKSAQPAGIETLSVRSKLARIDFLGAILLSSFILLLLLPLELGGNQVPWSHLLIPCLFGAAAIFLVLFVVAEKFWAKEPIMELSLFRQRDPLLCFLVFGLQSAAQLGMMFSVPLYFQVMQQVSNSEAGLHLLPSVIGNAGGGILAGILIKKSRTYKWLVYLGPLTATLCYVLLLLRWHGQTNWLESFYILPGGFGMGMTYSVLFVATQASVDPDLVSSAVSTLLLYTSIDMILGVASVSAVMKYILQISLEQKLFDLGLDRATRIEVISKAVSSVEYTYKAKGKVAQAIVQSYVDGLLYAHGLSFCFVILGFFFALFLTERKLQR